MKLQHHGFAILAAAACLWMSSCKCKEDPIQFDMPMEVDALIPYQTGQTIRFVNQGSDTLSLSVRDRSEAYYPKDDPTKYCPPQEHEEIVAYLDSSGHEFLRVVAVADQSDSLTYLNYTHLNAHAYILTATANAIQTNSRVQVMNNQTIQGQNYALVYVVEEVALNNPRYTHMWLAPGKGLVKAVAANGDFLEVLP